ncbi:hypothetical protein NDU88_004843 [Pleurodeles waltl]|uniref:Uncharacterized protein n=1 Tax=Pleurodeles waltl TaxID=8319 RepID=A0AAV7MAD4_PLEWA|nr:hypothetical protein NDU88_004843 [Pleurodeles waltl]
MMLSVDFSVFPNIWDLEGAVDDGPELGSDDFVGFVEDVVGAGYVGAVGSCGVGCVGGGRRRCEAFVYVYDLAVEVVGEGVAEVLVVWRVGGAGFGFGEFFNDGKKFLAVVRIVVYAFFLEGSFGGRDEVVMFVHG